MLKASKHEAGPEKSHPILLHIVHEMSCVFCLAELIRFSCEFRKSAQKRVKAREKAINEMDGLLIDESGAR